MGKASRLRRRAKLKQRERGHPRQQNGPSGSQRPAGSGAQPSGRQSSARQSSARQSSTGGASSRGPSGAGPASPGQQQPSASWRAEQLVAEAVYAHFRGDHGKLSRCVAQLAGQPGAAEWQRSVSRTLLTMLQGTVSTGWRHGWQPAELARQAGRLFGAANQRMATDMIAAEMRGYAVASVDDRWQAQLTSIDATVWWGSDDHYLDRWQDREHLDRAAAVNCALDLLFGLGALPELAVLCPLPGTARRGSLDSERSPRGPVDQRMLTRVRALLAKAESTEFPEEAEALTARAQELMARHSIDAALLAASAPKASGRDNPAGRRLFVDNPYEAAKSVLVNVVARANRCRAVRHRDLGLVTILGFPGDLDAVELLFTSLLVQATTAMVMAGSKRDAYGRSRTRSFRQSFLTSYAERIGERLTEAAGAAQRQAASDLPGTDLLPVLAARDHLVEEAVGTMFPRLTHTAAVAVNDYEGWIAGRAAADIASLHGRREVTGDAA